MQLFENHSEDNWTFYNIYTYDLKDNTLYFLLEKEKEGYCFYEITKQDALQYVKSFQGMGKKLIKY